jgi:hypothetical protein
MRRLRPTEELEMLREIVRDDELSRIVENLRGSFQVLQTRAQLLLGLVTICLTITGFSGPRIAESGRAASAAIFIGVVSVLATAIVLVLGPLNLRWMTRYRGETVDDTLVDLIRRRNRRTGLYRAGTVLLVVGLTGYVLSLGFYLLGKG